jgi:hypothetical protein
MTALARLPWVTGFILAGHSEGTHVATGILSARSAERVLAAGLFASTGPTQFWSSYIGSGGGSREAFERALSDMRMLQQADDDLMYWGLPARRWKTFALSRTPVDDVRDSVVPLFVAQGTNDGTTLASDLFVLEAVRQQPRRPIRYVVLEGGDHAFETGSGRRHVSAIFDDFLDWALDPRRATGVTVLH